MRRRHDTVVSLSLLITTHGIHYLRNDYIRRQKFLYTGPSIRGKIANVTIVTRRAMDIPSEEAISALPLGDLINLRSSLLIMTGTLSVTPLTTYDSILADTLSLARLLEGRAAQPPEPKWVREIEGEHAFDTLDDPHVVARIKELAATGLSEEDIWANLKKEFHFSEDEL
jgi:hypothetical protein